MCVKSQHFQSLILHGVLIYLCHLIVLPPCDLKEKTGGDSPGECEMGYYCKQEYWVRGSLASVVLLVILL